MDTELLSLVEDALARFNREHYAPAKLLQRMRAGAATPTDLTRGMADLGWFELLYDDDGVPARAISRVLPLFRAAGEGLWQEPLTSLLGEAAVIAARTESAALRTELIEGLVSGRRPLAYATRERGDGWADHAVTTTATMRDGVLRLEGEKIAVVEAVHCGAMIVLARDAETRKPAFYLVRGDAAGVHWRHARAIDGRSLADLQLSDAAAEYLCAGEHAVAAHAWGALLAAAESVGMMRGANRDTVAYLRERRQSGRPLLEFQVLQHRLVETHMLERETDALLQSVAVDHDEDGPSLERRLLVVRAQASRALRQVTAEAVQLHGGMGVTEEVRVSHYYRRALLLDSLHGAEEWALQRLSDDVLEGGAMVTEGCAAR